LAAGSGLDTSVLTIETWLLHRSQTKLS